MSGPELHFYYRKEDQEKVEISWLVYRKVAETHGLHIGRPVNYRIGDENFSYEFKVTPPTEEELAEARQNFEAAIERNDPPKLLLGPNDPVPDGYTGEWERSEWDLPLPYPTTLGWPDGPIIYGVDWKDSFPPGDKGSDIRDLKGLGSWTIEVPLVMLEDNPPFDWEELFSRPIDDTPPTSSLTIRQRLIRGYYLTRERWATWLYEKVSGHDLQGRSDFD